MIIVDLSILGLAVCLVLYAMQLLKKAQQLNESTTTTAAKHNDQLLVLKSRVDGMAQLSKRAIDIAKRPCEKCGHVPKVPFL